MDATVTHPEPVTAVPACWVPGGTSLWHSSQSKEGTSVLQPIRGACGAEVRAGEGRSGECVEMCGEGCCWWQLLEGGRHLCGDCRGFPELRLFCLQCSHEKRPMRDLFGAHLCGRERTAEAKVVKQVFGEFISS